MVESWWSGVKGLDERKERALDPAPPDEQGTMPLTTADLVIHGAPGTRLD